MRSKISLPSGNITLQRKISLPSGNITLQRKISLRQQYRSRFTGRRGRRPLRLHSITRRQSTSFDAIILLLNLPILAFPFGEGGPLAVEEVLRLSKFCNNLCLHVWNLSRLLLILADRQISLCKAKYNCRRQYRFRFTGRRGRRPLRLHSKHLPIGKYHFATQNIRQALPLFTERACPLRRQV